MRIVNNIRRWRMPSSGMWRRVDLVWIYVSEEGIASIFRVEHLRARNQCEQVAASWACLRPSAHTGSSLADFYTLKMEAIRSSETSVHTRSTRRHIPEGGILYSHRRENLKSYIIFEENEVHEYSSTKFLLLECCNSQRYSSELIL
jgi:hypothetical protein